MVSNKPLLVSGCFGAAGKVVSSSAGCLLVQCLLSPVVISPGTPEPQAPLSEFIVPADKSTQLVFLVHAVAWLWAPSLRNLSENQLHTKLRILATVLSSVTCEWGYWQYELLLQKLLCTVQHCAELALRSTHTPTYTVLQRRKTTFETGIFHQCNKCKTNIKSN